MLLAIVLACALGVVALTFVLIPLFRFSSEGRAQIAQQGNGNTLGNTNALQEREQSARSALQEIELDYQLGNIGEEDYNTLRERYVRRALLALKSRHESGQDEIAEPFERDKEFDDLIEARLRKLKEQDARD